MRKNRPVLLALKLRVETAKKLIPLELFTGERRPVLYHTECSKCILTIIGNSIVVEIRSNGDYTICSCHSSEVYQVSNLKVAINYDMSLCILFYNTVIKCLLHDKKKKKSPCGTLQCVIITYINCPTRWCPSGLTPTHHQFGGVNGTGGEHTKVVPAHIGLGRMGVVIGPT